MSMHHYRGFEIYPLIYLHVPAEDGRSRNRGAGYDAAVKVCPQGNDSTTTPSQTFKVVADTPFENHGDARRASLRFAENVIDEKRGEMWLGVEVA